MWRNVGTTHPPRAFKGVTVTAPDLPNSGNPSNVAAGYEPVGASLEVGTIATSFDGFFTEHYDRIARALAVVVGDDHLGRDAASEGFAKALQRWNRVQNYANPSGWVYRVGLNWARSRRRKTRREVAPLPADLHGATVGIGDHEPGLAPALAALSVDHRAVVVARYHLDWSEAQIASALDIKPGTVKSRLSRALDELSTALGAN